MIIPHEGTYTVFYSPLSIYSGVKPPVGGGMRRFSHRPTCHIWGGGGVESDQILDP